MAKCMKCGAYCREHYTYCRECYFEMGQPYGKATERQHKCRSCGATIRGRYSYCYSCAHKKRVFESHRENAIRRAKDEAVHIEQKDIQGR